LAFENFATTYPPVKAGRLKGIAVTTAKRSALVPSVPTLAESGLAGYDITSWQAMFAPAGTPKEVIARIYAEVARLLKESEVRKKIQDLGADPGGMTPEELGALIKADIPRLGKIVKESGAVVD
jgi:tripartite-type tricarboxylate transporter receptor subunit TctC